jgi:hypothetical protein
MVEDGCVLCGLTVRSALTNAHAHAGSYEDPDRVFRLCWTCHRMYDHDIIRTAEVAAAEAAWAAGLRPDATSLHRRIEAELASGLRLVDKSRQHKGAATRAGQTRGRSNRARRAWATRRKNSAPA